MSNMRTHRDYGGLKTHTDYKEKLLIQLDFGDIEISELNTHEKFEKAVVEKLAKSSDFAGTSTQQLAEGLASHIDFSKLKTHADFPEAIANALDQMKEPEDLSNLAVRKDSALINPFKGKRNDIDLNLKEKILGIPLSSWKSRITQALINKDWPEWFFKLVSQYFGGPYSKQEHLDVTNKRLELLWEKKAEIFMKLDFKESNGEYTFNNDSMAKFIVSETGLWMDVVDRAQMKKSIEDTLRFAEKQISADKEDDELIKFFPQTKVVFQEQCEVLSGKVFEKLEEEFLGGGLVKYEKGESGGLVPVYDKDDPKRVLMQQLMNYKSTGSGNDYANPFFQSLVSKDSDNKISSELINKFIDLSIKNGILGSYSPKYNKETDINEILSEELKAYKLNELAKSGEDMTIFKEHLIKNRNILAVEGIKDGGDVASNITLEEVEKFLESVNKENKGKEKI